MNQNRARDNELQRAIDEINAEGSAGARGGDAGGRAEAGEWGGAASPTSSGTEAASATDAADGRK